MSYKRKTEDQGECNRPKIETFDDILPYVGEAGRYQWFLFFLLLPFTLVYAFLYFAQYFITLLPDEYWCKIPEFESLNLTNAQKIALSIPPSNVDERTAELNLSYSRCKMYNINYTDIIRKNITQADPNWPTSECKYGHEFDYTHVPYMSIAAEHEWLCDQSILSSAAQSAFFAGSIVGGLVYGYIADHYGRLPALVICNGVGFFASIATALCNDFWSFALIRFVTGTSFDNCFNIIFIIVIEYVGPKYRTLIANMSFGIYFAVASAILPWLAYWISDWKMLAVYSALPLVVAFITPWIVPESARWYISNGRVDKAIEMLKKFEKVNKKNVQAEVYEEFERCTSASASVNNNYTVLHLFKYARSARIMIILIIYWLIIIFVFDGHVWNMKLLEDNVFMSFSLAASTELPAAIILALCMDKWGRRWMAFYSMLLCGIFSFIAAGQPKGITAMAFAVIARLGVNVATNIGFQWAAEMLPTVVRAQGISLMHICGYSAHILGPYIVYLAEIHPTLPLVTLGSLSILNSALSLTLPETMDQELPETLEDGNVFGKEQNFWWMPCIKATPEKKKKYRKNLGDINLGFSRGSLYRISA